ncbi:hypothetical protein GUJ93_ZPchr0013g34138 [Zizania palustris]|uniref:Uncharacterized protein n=1 Tax=Zizania palustris TaxID=103762 RepID=A0A8J5WYI8_ZIZPA|nr:hypothetical protein GUJ93_ZPchr0013g34138 [Zizania palustris]
MAYMNADAAAAAASRMHATGVNRAAAAAANPNVHPAVPHVYTDPRAPSTAHARAAAMGSAGSTSEPAAYADRRVVASMADAHTKAPPPSCTAPAAADGERLALVEGVFVSEEEPSMGDLDK